MKLLKRPVIIVITVVFVLVIVFSSFLFLNYPQNGEVNREPIDVAYSPFESLALFWVAQDQGFFSGNGLNVTAHTYASGAAALGGVVSGEADIAVGTAEFPLAIRALNNESVKTMATISKSNFIYLIGRSDRAIYDVLDFKGKTIGTTFGTIANYYLGRFLVLNGLRIEDVTLVDLKTPNDWVNAVVNGSIDAVATAQPYANSAKDGLGANAVVWSINSDQPQYTQAIASNKWIANNPDLCRRFLSALHQAEGFVMDHPAEAKAIVKQQMNFSDAYMETVWSQNQYALSLDQSLILDMENEARWLISNNLTNQTMVPDFTNYIYVAGLASVKPESVTITP
jgi:ABC-type nitrate/sulfonate/bicarbonate transport system substrate-binding protein